MKTIVPKLLAEALAMQFLQPKYYNLPEGVRVAPDDKTAVDVTIFLYQFASVSLALAREAETRPEFSSVLGHFEQILFLNEKFPVEISQNVPIIRDDLLKLFDLRNAGDAMFWARNWLEGLGIVENNPITLQEIATKWIGYYTAARQAIGDFDLRT